MKIERKDLLEKWTRERLQGYWWGFLTPWEDEFWQIPISLQCPVCGSRGKICCGY